MDFINIIEREYSRRTAINKSYSLRAFARDLQINQSSLSKILARKRNLTDDVILRMATHLKLPHTQTKKFLSVSRSKIKTAHYKSLNYEHFVVVSDWYHDAILELIDTDDFKGDTKWIAKKIGIKESQVKAAVRRLTQIEFLKIEDNKWTDNSKLNSIHPENISTDALKNYQKQILGNSIAAIDAVDLNDRSHTSNTFSASKENIEDAKKIIAKCRKDIAALLRSSSQPKTDVFQFQISLFPITKHEGEKS